MKKVYICSPCRGDIEKHIEKAQRYCRAAVPLWDDVLPLAPHAYFTQLLDYTQQEARAARIGMGRNDRTSRMRKNVADSGII